VHNDRGQFVRDVVSGRVHVEVCDRQTGRFGCFDLLFVRGGIGEEIEFGGEGDSGFDLRGGGFVVFEALREGVSTVAYV
jgi:hypothetical protein